MIIVADEAIERQIVDILVDYGFNIISIRENFPGITDTEVLKICEEEKAVLLTSDKDFGELVFRRKMVHFGIVLIRIFGISLEKKKTIILNCFRDHIDEFAKNFTVITDKDIRIRKSL